MRRLFLNLSPFFTGRGRELGRAIARMSERVRGCHRQHRDRGEPPSPEAFGFDL
jgi:hypothetical protein